MLMKYRPTKWSQPQPVETPCPYSPRLLLLHPWIGIEQPLLLPRFLDALLSSIERALSLRFFGHLLICFGVCTAIRNGGLRHGFFLSQTCALLCLECYLIFVHLLLFFLWCFERLCLAAYKAMLVLTCLA